MIGNCIANNIAAYHDTIYTSQMIVNLTGNVIRNNTGLHTLHVSSSSLAGTAGERSSVMHNSLYDNWARGHGWQFEQWRYGYFGDEQQRGTRVRRQVSGEKKNRNVLYE
jgi:hypothetical protein